MPTIPVIWTSVSVTPVIEGSTLTWNNTVSFAVVTVCAPVTSVTINLPAVSGKEGRSYTIKATTLNNAIVIDPNGSELIDDALTYTFSSPKEAVRIITDGSKWWIF